MRANRLLGISLILSTALLWVLFALGAETPVRAVIALAYLGVAPGWAVISLLGLAQRWAAALLAVALSLGIVTVVATALLLAHAWTPGRALAIVGCITLLAAGASLVFPLGHRVPWSPHYQMGKGVNMAASSQGPDQEPGAVLVTGGAGFIGSHLVDQLVRAGARTIVLDDFSSGDAANLPAGIEVIRADIADPATIDLIAAARPDAIVHAAAQVSVPRSMADPDRDRAVNLVGTEHVLAGAQAAGGARVVFVSTGGGIYGETPEPATEHTLPRPKAYYSIHKYAAERYLELSGLPYAIARLANVYGPRQRSDLEGGVVAILAERLAAGLPITIFGTGEQRRDFVHVFDVVRALLAMLQSDATGLWNVGTGTMITVNELLRATESVFGVAAAVEYAPSRPGDVFQSCLAVDAIQRDLGWAPTISLAEGLRTLAEPAA